MDIHQIATLCESRRNVLCTMADKIFDYAEVGLKEVKSSALLEDYLEQQGFTVEKGVGTLPTAFRATWKQGEGGPRLGLLCEYDALEGMGHGCGHHMQGPSIIGAALAIRDLFQGGGVPFSIVIYGTPAEETIGGKTVMLENGCFKDIDLALMMHAAPTTCVDVRCMADMSYLVEFHGKSAHAAMNPEKGRSAFDAAILSFNAIEFLREHVEDDTRMHYTVRDAGGPANVVPDRTIAQYELRSYDTDYLRSLEPRFMDILKGAALMTGTTYTIPETHEFYAKIPCLTLNDLVMEQARAFHAPQLAEPRKGRRPIPWNTSKPARHRRPTTPSCTAARSWPPPAPGSWRTPACWRPCGKSSGNGKQGRNKNKNFRPRTVAPLGRPYASNVQYGSIVGATRRGAHPWPVVFLKSLLY